MIPTPRLNDNLPGPELDEITEAVAGKFAAQSALVRLTGAGGTEGSAKELIRKAVSDGFSVTPGEALVKSWKSGRELAALVGKDGPQDGKTRYVPAWQDGCKVTYKHKIVLELGKAVEIPVSLELSVSADTKIACLAVCDRKVTDISKGTIRFGVTAKVDGQKVSEYKTAEHDLSLTALLNDS